MRRRVVITGLGAVTPIGIGVKAFWHGLREGVLGIAPITRFDPAPFPCKVAAEVKGFDPAEYFPEEVTPPVRFAQYGMAAARMAYDDAGLGAVPAARRFALCFGSGASGAPEFQGVVERVGERAMRRRDASAVIESIGLSLTNYAAVAMGMAGQTMTLASGCASGIDSIQWAHAEIAAGRFVGAFAGAADAPLTTAVHGAWGKLGWLSRWEGPPGQALRPFDALSDGSVLGEGAGVYVLEDLDHARARGAHIYAEVLGYGTGSDGLDLRSVHPAGASLQRAMRLALRDAGLEPEAVDHINAHGGGVPKHDRAETAAYRAVLGRHADSVAVTSIKAMIGQPFAAGGALQVIAACFSLAEQFVPPTMNHDFPDVGCDLDYVPYRGRPARVERVLVTARAIGPTHAAVILGRVGDA
ncbi:MAG TPA: beta-ketoacyl-[acyl-carrier-protein] synthase family protein [Methylomirabilota bacterium]|jgi:3-oxoacyl-[acyl-carrier-protein] synthase II|nr:beta-ketoacyl-[acyl-carrier-protein] synthase family protein [Methylomirabilota bacterium]